MIIEVPFDPHLRPGRVIDVNNEMSPKTRRRFYEIAAASSAMVVELPVALDLCARLAGLIAMTVELPKVGVRLLIPRRERISRGVR